MGPLLCQVKTCAVFVPIAFHYSCCAPAIMVQSVENWKCDDLTFSFLFSLRNSPHRNFLVDPLVRSGLVEELNVFPDHSMQMILPQDQQMIKAFSPYAAQESFADRVGFWRDKAFSCFQTHCRRPLVQRGPPYGAIWHKSPCGWGFCRGHPRRFCTGGTRGALSRRGGWILSQIPILTLTNPKSCNSFENLRKLGLSKTMALRVPLFGVARRAMIRFR